MRYSMEPIYARGYRLLSFTKNFDTRARKVAKNESNNYSQNIIDSAKKSTTAAIKISLKRTIQKTAEATGDLIANKIADKIASISKSSKEFHSDENDENRWKWCMTPEKTTNYGRIKISIII